MEKFYDSVLFIARKAHLPHTSLIFFVPRFIEAQTWN